MNTTSKVLVGIGALGLVALILKNQSAKKAPPQIFYRKGNFRYNAQTLPPFGIYINESHKNNQALLKHELIHWKQYQDKGLLKYYFDYTTQLLKHGYDSMPMEKEARTNESRFCKNNYTECVRTGKARTVHNPNFRI